VWRLERYLAGPDVGRPSPSSDELRRAFRAEISRTQRRSDGTLSLEGRRFEVPSRYRQLTQLRVRYARWDLRHVDLVDPHTGTLLATLSPLDKHANAHGRRRRLDPPVSPAPVTLSAEPARGDRAPVAQAHGRLRRHRAAPGLSGPPPPRPRGAPGMSKKLLALYGLKWNPARCSPSSSPATAASPISCVAKISCRWAPASGSGSPWSTLPATSCRPASRHLLSTAGHPTLMTPELMHTLCEHALGNYRVLTTMAAELLAAAAQRELPQLDEKLYLELFVQPRPTAKSRRPVPAESRP
jgi:hypothetical protein